jgi:phage virion morphogenesis protein
MIDINIKGSEALRIKLNNLDSALATREILDASGAFTLHRIRERYLRQEAPDGTTWVESYAAKRRKAKGKDGGTLFDTGRLFHSITLGRATKNTRSIFTNVPYGRRHQHGLGIIKRKFLGFNESDELGVEALLRAKIKGLL